MHNSAIKLPSKKPIIIQNSIFNYDWREIALGVLNRGILAIPGADTVLKGPRIAKFWHKGVKFGGEITRFFAEWEKL